MDEVKFRYIYSNGKEIKTFIYTIEDIEIMKAWNDGKAIVEEGFKLISRDRFTGLKDKNGVEIFENDIVVYGESPEKHIIEWLEDECKYMALYFKESDRDIYTGYKMNPRLKIISNTHIEKVKEKR